eukprot:COSAG02_NODE_3509_length_6634_cov_2.750574_5_plen_150_part_00
MACERIRIRDGTVEGERISDEKTAKSDDVCQILSSLYRLFEQDVGSLGMGDTYFPIHPKCTVLKNHMKIRKHRKIIDEFSLFGAPRCAKCFRYTKVGGLVFASAGGPPLGTVEPDEIGRTGLKLGRGSACQGRGRGRARGEGQGEDYCG